MKHYTIWDEMRRMQEQMDSVFANFFDTEPMLGSGLLLENKGNDVEKSKYHAPASDIWETDKEVIAEVDLPGIDKKDIKINLNDDNIEIKAEKKTEKEDKKKGFYRQERCYSGFYRQFPLPSNIKADKAEAEYKDGVLKLKIPKMKIEQRKVKQIEVK